LVVKKFVHYDDFTKLRGKEFLSCSPCSCFMLRWKNERAKVALQKAKGKKKQ
jgi:hypothetical protein